MATKKKVVKKKVVTMLVTKTTKGTKLKPVKPAEATKLLDEKVSKFLVKKKAPGTAPVEEGSALVKVATALPAGVQAVTSQVNSLAARVETLDISADTVSEARRLLATVKKHTETFVKARQALTKPLKDHAKNIEAMFRPTLSKLEDIDQKLRRKVLDFEQAAAQAAFEARAQLTAQATAAAEEGDHNMAAALAEEATQLEAATVAGSEMGVGGVSTGTTKTFKVVDFALIPREFFTLDDKKVLAAIRAGQESIPGIEIVIEKTLRVSARDATAVEVPPDMGMLAPDTVDTEFVADTSA